MLFLIFSSTIIARLPKLIPLFFLPPKTSFNDLLFNSFNSFCNFVFLSPLVFLIAPVKYFFLASTHFLAAFIVLKLSAFLSLNIPSFCLLIQDKNGLVFSTLALSLSFTIRTLFSFILLFSS